MFVEGDGGRRCATERRSVGIEQRRQVALGRWRAQLNRGNGVGHGGAVVGVDRFGRNDAPVAGGGQRIEWFADEIGASRTERIGLVVEIAGDG